MSETTIPPPRAARPRRACRGAAVPLAAALALGAVLPAVAQTRLEGMGLALSATPTGATDFVFRGNSQTRNRPAAQLAVDAVHDSGLYAGLFGSNVGYRGTNAHQLLLAKAGYRFDALGLKWDVGGIYYGFPGYTRPTGGLDLEFYEAQLRASRKFGDLNLSVGLNGSPNYFAQSGTAITVEGVAEYTLPYGFSASARVAHIWIERNDRFGLPDYFFYSAGIGKSVLGFDLAVNYWGNDFNRSQCAGGSKICDERFVFSISRTF